MSNVCVDIITIFIQSLYNFNLDNVKLARYVIMQTDRSIKEIALQEYKFCLHVVLSRGSQGRIVLS